MFKKSIRMVSFHAFQYYWNLMNMNNRSFLSKFSIKLDPYTNG